eukprot:scaffold4850_cov340-Prasinococcus_capsulatus_cf.AAC.4
MLLIRAPRRTTKLVVLGSLLPHGVWDVFFVAAVAVAWAIPRRHKPAPLFRRWLRRGRSGRSFRRCRVLRQLLVSPARGLQEL